MSKQKLLTLTLGAAAAVALCLSGCSSGASDSAGESGGASDSKTGGNANTPEGLTDGKLINCIDPEYAPLEYYENGSSGEIVGFDADLTRLIAEHWGVEYEFAVTAFDGLMPGLQAKRCDIMLSGLYMSEDRLAVADASPTMQTGSMIVALPENAKKIKDKMDLCGQSVVAQAASVNGKMIVALSDECEAAGKDKITLAEYPKTAETVLAVLNGKSDYLIETDVSAAYLVTQNRGKLEATPERVFPIDTQFGVFTRKGESLGKAVTKALDELRQSGELEKLAEKYGLDTAAVNLELDN